MVVLSRIIVLLCLFFSPVTFADIICSAQNPCPDGLACIGSTGLSGNGVCVASGPNIVLCNIVGYFDSKLATSFTIFAVVMIGIAFFLGKISWGMIVSVILGVAIIKGATTVIKHVSGQDDGYCSSAMNNGEVNQAQCIQTVSQVLDTPYVYNITSTDGCKTELLCTKKTCSITQTMYIIQTNNGDLSQGSGHTNRSISSGQEIFLPVGSSTITATSCTQSDWNDVTKTCNSKTVNCSNVEKSTKQDYFRCYNSCTQSYTAHYEQAGKYTSCIELMGLSIERTI